MTTLGIILLLVAVSTAAITVHWGIKRTQYINSADYHTDRFVAAAKKIIDDPNVPDDVKDELRYHGSIIGNVRAAKLLGQIIERREFQRLVRHSERQLPGSILFLTEEQKINFFSALYQLLFALSYRDYRNGWRVRRWLTSDPPFTITENPPYVAVAVRVTHGDGRSHFAPAA